MPCSLLLGALCPPWQSGFYVYIYAAREVDTQCDLQVRANALLEVGGSPVWTLTEDYALGMELKKFGWHCRYVQEYLAIGEAPDQIRNCYQQRSRWCKVPPCILSLLLVVSVLIILLSGRQSRPAE